MERELHYHNLEQIFLKILQQHFYYRFNYNFILKSAGSNEDK